MSAHLGSHDRPLPPDILEAIRAALGTQYEIDRVLGSGAMGSVLLAHDRTLDRPVAVKIINPELAATSTFRQRFLQEARTIAKLRHGNIVGVHAAGEAAGVLYYIMEFVPGESLRDLLQREGALPPARAVAILRALADALGYAHRAGVIHRDIKPENILIDAATGHARLTDFGISRSLAAAGDRMTGTGMSVGTPAYMSPEQASGERETDGRSDLYSLGLVGYEMLAGAPAFTGKTSASVIMKQITEQPAPLIDRAAGVSPSLAAVILGLRGGIAGPDSIMVYQSAAGPDVSIDRLAGDGALVGMIEPIRDWTLPITIRLVQPQSAADTASPHGRIAFSGSQVSLPVFVSRKPQ